MGIFDSIPGATNVSNAVNQAVTGSGIVNGLQSGANALNNIKNSISGGLNNVAGQLSSVIPGQISSALAAVPVIKDLDILGILQKAKSIVTVPGLPPFPNVLHNYASYNCIWTLSVLTPQDLNFPDESYRKGKLGPIILRSGSGYPNDRISTTYKSASNPSGKFDYFIDNVRVSGMMGFDKSTGNTNATTISFDITEPYSMGLFFQSLQIAALQGGYQNWVDLPLLLKLEFLGHIDALRQNVSIPGTTKYFPLKVRNITMRVSGNGSVYACEAIPWNEKAHATTYSQIKTEVNISGSTVQEMIQNGTKSLQKVVNDRYLEAVKRKDTTVPDQILILFPTDIKTSDAATVSDDTSTPATATAAPTDSATNQTIFKRLGVARGTDGFNLVQNDNINPIGAASMGFNEYRKGDASFGKENAVYDEKSGTYKRGNITTSKTSSEARFGQGTDIPNVINQIILASDYGRQALDPDNITDDGFINWWKIETQVYILDNDSNLQITGRKPNLIVYRVIPHRVHHSKFMAPNSAAKGVEKLKLEAIKEYNYLYTSKNLDILDFNIEFNSAFYTALTADRGKNNADTQRTKETGGVASRAEENNGDGANNGVTRPADSGNMQAADLVVPLGGIPGSSISDQVNSRSGNKGGLKDDPATMAARQFHDAITEGADMVQVDLRILGDPFYLGDSGMGNYSAQATNLKGLTADGGINYQDGQVYINVKFRNPVDISNITGRYDFPSGDTVTQFSGLYMVSKVENTFSRNQFTQVLSLSRMVGQDVKDDGSAGKTLVSKIVESFNPNKPTDYQVTEPPNP
jgi:hypothetical protein